MSLLRTFIAIEFPPAIQNAIYEACKPLRQLLEPSSVRWVPPQNIHLTLKFLGEISPTNLEMLTQMLKTEANQHTPFEMEIGGLGSFPNPRRARVIWVGIRAPASLETLQRNVEAATVRLGYPAEERRFSPHLTIGRVNQHVTIAGQQKIRSALESIQIGAIGNVKVTAIHLFRSDLQPSGSVYTLLFQAPLRNHL